MKVALHSIVETAKKHPGMMDAFLKLGELRGDHVEISREAFDKINSDFLRGVKLGTILHVLISPIAKVSDAALGTDLAGCASCGGRELELNAASKASSS